MKYLNRSILHFIVTLLSFVMLCFPSFAVEYAPPISGPLTSPWSGARAHPVTGEVRRHDGIDIGVPIGTPVPAITSGYIGYAGWCDGYGNFVSIVDSEGVAWNYAHLDSIVVNEGDYVSADQLVAYSGNTGIGTGAHLHAERRVGGTWADSSDPLPYYASKWNIGDYAGEIYDILGGAYQAVKRMIEIDFDYTNYFSPSEILMTLFNKIIALLTLLFGKLEDALLELLLALFVLDLGWLLCKALSTNEFDLASLVPRFIRYGFYLFMFKSWETLVKNVFIPFFEEVGSTFAGTEFSENTFLHFDVLFSSVVKIIANFIHPKVSVVDIAGKISPEFLYFIFENICVITILLITLSLCLWMMTKILNFYIICVFGILGIPITFIPHMERDGKTFFSSVFSSVLDLIITCFLFSLLLNYLSTISPIPGDSLSGLIGFVTLFSILSVFLTQQSGKMRTLFHSILN